jgi:hypothetical protein
LTGDDKEKSRAELWSFTSAVLPLVNSYSPTVGATLLANTKITNPTTAPLGRAAVKASLESVYGAIGITCSDVGGLLIPGTKTYYTGMEPCSNNDVVGYTLQSDVTQHLELDLDLSQMVTALALKPPGLAAAYTAYSKGNPT